MKTKKISPFRTRNIPAYLTVMGVAFFLVVLIYFISGNFFFNENSITLLLIIAASVMAGMMVMFGASMLNLFKMKSALEKISRGEQNVKIPEVWCPVLTAASEAVENLAESKQFTHEKKEN
ncbi:MAG: hypothetical protein WDZ45_13385 [Flavobacteriaceae bacterium]